jgi:hypothetical protein
MQPGGQMLKTVSSALNWRDSLTDVRSRTSRCSFADSMHEPPDDSVKLTLKGRGNLFGETVLVS